MLLEGQRGRKGNERRPHLPHGWLDSQVIKDPERAQV
ncbi:hypothetical protein B178_09651 [Corynebacterium diphtheriae DSM 43988]|nr:hypothetical protein W5M_10081 [Corynebacterium diphtheriae bv. intermedius str. NCTC 5011]ERA50121.1 hypothetical protein B178_09651 [Corynebacterium diphtheriae DSM 43988]